MQELLDAINRLNNALNEAAARDAARDIGAAIGGVISYPLKKTTAEIDAMTWAEMQAWGSAVQESPPDLLAEEGGE